MLSIGTFFTFDPKQRFLVILKYDEAPVGKNSLSALMKEMCKEAGLEKKTNNSLRATGTSAMFRAICF